MKKPRRLYDPKKVHVPLILEKPANFYKAVCDSKEVAKAFVTLSTCMHALKLELGNFKKIWQKYSNVWSIDRDRFIEDMEVS